MLCEKNVFKVKQIIICINCLGELYSLGFRAVKFTLHTRDLLSTVLYILNSCSLSIEHVQSLNTNVHSQPLKEAKRTSDRPIKWDKSYYSFTGFKDPDEDLEQVWRTETTLTYVRVFTYLLFMFKIVV